MDASEFLTEVRNLNARFNSGEIGVAEWSELMNPLVTARERQQATERRSDDEQE